MIDLKLYDDKLSKKEQLKRFERMEKLAKEETEKIFKNIKKVTEK